MNYKGCASCNQISIPKIINKKKDETELTESVTYTHVCAECEHVIAQHNWEFEIVDENQEYSMDCELCGYAQSTHAIDPTDSAEMNKYL